MNYSNTGGNSIQIILITILICVIYYFFILMTGLKANFAESNLQSNLIRISRYLNEPTPDFVLVGSSVAGRLLPEYFQGNESIQNLGLDGGRPIFCFEIVRMKPELPDTILLDTSTLFAPPSRNDQTIRAEINSPGFRLSRYLHLNRPEYRPSSVMYSFIKSRNDSISRRTQPSYLTGQNSDMPGVVEEKISGIENPNYVLAREAVAGMQDDGVKMVIVSIPRKAGWGQPMAGLERELADELSIPVLEPGPELAADDQELRFSDSRHLAAPSAKLVAQWISERMSGISK